MSIVGSPGRWARDFGVIGAFSGFFGAGLGTFRREAVVACVVGGLVGSLIGAALPLALDRVRGRVPIPVLLLLGFPAGAAWGAITGVAASQVQPFNAGLLLWAVVAGIAGALQLGAIWFPYTFLSVLRRPTWPVVVAACLLATQLGWIAEEAFLLSLHAVALLP